MFRGLHGARSFSQLPTVLRLHSRKAAISCTPTPLASGDAPDVEAIDALLADADPTLLIIAAVRLLHAVCADLGHALGISTEVVLDGLTQAIVAMTPPPDHEP
jgi:hypothetical protein